jgi:CheY-like chemotaxis protein
LTDTRVLVVEDEPLIAMLLEEMLNDLGISRITAVGRLEQALGAAQREVFDLAFLDVNLNGELTYPIAERLSARGIPFVFVTGYGVAGLDEKLRGIEVLRKPFSVDDVAKVVDRLLGPNGPKFGPGAEVRMQ